jgi:hypothetical protein
MDEINHEDFVDDVYWYQEHQKKNQNESDYEDFDE